MTNEELQQAIEEVLELKQRLEVVESPAMYASAIQGTKYSNLQMLIDLTLELQSRLAKCREALEMARMDYDGAMTDIEELVRVALTNRGSLEDFIRMNYPSEYKTWQSKLTEKAECDGN